MKTIILYHGDCPDGFGAAYAAWKKFKDAAEYHALSRGDGPPLELVEGADVYLLDFAYNEQSDMDALQERAASLTVLDHHKGVEAQIKSVKNHVYDPNRSGAGIAWDYFHEGERRPKLIDHLEDDDLFRFKYADTRPVLAYLGLEPFSFELWDEVMETLEDPARAVPFLTKARAYGECFEKLALLSVAKAKLVEFEGHVVGFANAHPYKPIKSLVGNLLAKKYSPFALVVSAHPEGYGVSMRGDGSIDLTKIAQKYGGNGHHSSVGFLIPREGPFPWTIVEEGYDK
jgi:uncharacterized protein